MASDRVTGLNVTGWLDTPWRNALAACDRATERVQQLQDALDDAVAEQDRCDDRLRELRTPVRAVAPVIAMPGLRP